MFNPLTKREVIRRTYKIIGPTVSSQTRPEYEIDDAGCATKTTVTQDMSDETTDVTVYKYLIGTVHRGNDELELYKVVDVLEETFADQDGPLIVAYRRLLKVNGKFEANSEDDEYPIHIQDIL